MRSHYKRTGWQTRISRRCVRKSYQEICMCPWCMGTETNNTTESVTLLTVTLLKPIKLPEAMQHTGKQDWWNLRDHHGELKHQSPLLKKYNLFFRGNVTYPGMPPFIICILCRLKPTGIWEVNRAWYHNRTTAQAQISKLCSLHGPIGLA